MTTAQAAAQLGVSEETVRKAISRKRMRATKVGRDWSISPRAVEAYRAASLGRPGRPRGGP